MKLLSLLDHALHDRVIFKSRRPHSTIRRRNRGYILEKMKHLTDEMFKKMFCLSRKKYSDLVDKFKVAIEPNNRGKTNV